MNGNELLLSLSEIDPALIGEAARSLKRPGRRIYLRWTGILAACLALVIAAGGFSGRLLRGGRQAGAPIGLLRVGVPLNQGSKDYYSPVNRYWTVTELNGWNEGEDGEKSIVIESVGEAGIEAQVEIVPERRMLDELPEEKIALICGLVGQWASTQLTFDYARHFELFRSDAVDLLFTRYLESGLYPLTYEEALEGITRNAKALMPFDSISFSCALTDYRVPESEEVAEKECWYGDWSVDVNDIQECFYFTLQKTYDLRVGGILRMDPKTQEGWEFFAYRYDGVWYLSTRLMDDDFSEDLATADRFPDEFFRTIGGEGTVEWISGSYLCVGDRVLFASDPAALAGLTVGDEVGYSCLEFGYRVLTESGSGEDRTMELNQVTEITRTGE